MHAESALAQPDLPLASVMPVSPSDRPVWRLRHLLEDGRWPRGCAGCAGDGLLFVHVAWWDLKLVASVRERLGPRRSAPEQQPESLCKATTKPTSCARMLSGMVASICSASSCLTAVLYIRPDALSDKSSPLALHLWRVQTLKCSPPSPSAVLYVRPDAVFDKSKPISGGIPHCFPQVCPRCCRSWLL